MINLGDIKVDRTINIPFNTFDSDGASVTVTNLAATDVHIHKNGGTTQRSSSAGITVSIDFDGITGNHLITIDLSDNTDAGFYATGNDYDVRLEGITVDTQTLNVWVGSFSIENRVSDVVKISGDATAADNLEATYDGTGYDNAVAPAQQQQVSNITVGSAGISTTATTAVLTTGSEVLTYTATQERDGTTHDVSDAAGTTDIYYEFNVGAVGVPTSVTLYGRLFNNTDTLKIEGYNWGATTWEQIGTLQGKVLTTFDELTFSMYSTHVGTGANSGKVRVRFQNTGLTSSTLYLDQLYVSYTNVQSIVGYANGSIWVDTVNGNSGAVTGVNGVADFPVNNWSDALTISANTGLTNFRIINGSTITLSSDSSNYTLTGESWILNLNGQIITGAYFSGASVSGTGSNGGTIPEFDNCILNVVTIPLCTIRSCAISDTVTINEAGTYYFENCYSGVAGTSAPILDFAAIGDTNVNFRHYSGGIEIRNMGQSGTDTMSLEGWGQYVLNANCVGGTLAIRGHFKKTDNSGNVTISDDANFKTDVITFGKVAASTSNTITLASTASAMDGAYDPSLVFIVSGTGAGQTRLILEYNGSTKIAVIDRNWKENPDTTSEYRIVAHPGREHVNEGLAQAGSSNTITLNALASNQNDAYNGQLVFLRSGTGEDQVRLVSDYDGTTKIATVSLNWSITPDTTSAYVMIPQKQYLDTEIAAANWAAATRTLTAGTKDSEIDAILVDTGTTIPNQITALNDVSTAQVQSSCDAAITANSDINNIDIGVDAIEAKLPTNNIMGSSVKTDKDDEIDAIKVVTDKLDDTLEDDAGTYRFTANALEEAPGGSGGDATATNQVDMIDKLKGLMSKDYSLLTEVGTFDPSTDSNEAIRNRGDAAWLTGGGLTGSNTCTLTIQDEDANNVVEAAVEIYDSGGTTYYERRTTNSSGQTIHQLDNGTYIVKIHKAGYTFSNQTLVVDGIEAETYTGTTINIGAPSSPDTIRLFDYCMGQDELPVSSAIGEATIVSLPYSYNSSLHSGEKIDGIYNATTGLIYWDIVKGAKVKVNILGFGAAKKVTLPTTGDTVRLSSL